MPQGSQSYVIQASDYDQACEVDSDCVLIGEGDICACQGVECPNAAINRVGEADYQADRDAEDCVMPVECGSLRVVEQATSCALLEPVCKDGVCQPKEYDDIIPWGQNVVCESDDDCVVIAGNDSCEPCSFAIAVNGTYAAELEVAWSETGCDAVEHQCACATPPGAKCDAGQCVVDADERVDVARFGATCP